MADTQGARRSGRARHQTKSYAEEQAEEQSTTTSPPAKRKRAAAKTSKAKQSKDAPGDDTMFKSEAADADTEKPLRKKAKAKAAKSQQANDEADLPALKIEDPEDDGDFKPAPKKTKKASKRVKEIGKLDSEGVMRLDTTEKRPPGEKRPPRVYEIPPNVKEPKDESFNLAAILAASFEDRWERKVSKIPRLPAGAPEVRLKE